MAPGVDLIVDVLEGEILPGLGRIVVDLVGNVVGPFERTTPPRFELGLLTVSSNPQNLADDGLERIKALDVLTTLPELLTHHLTVRK